MWPNKHWVKGYNCFPQSTSYGPCNTAQDAVRFSAARGRKLCTVGAVASWFVRIKDHGYSSLLDRLQKGLHQEGNLLTFLKILLFSTNWKMPISSPAFWRFAECTQLFFLVSTVFWQNINLPWLDAGMQPQDWVGTALSITLGGALGHGTDTAAHRYAALGSMLVIRRCDRLLPRAVVLFGRYRG